MQMKEEDRPKSATPYHEKYMLTIKESAEYFNVGTKMLRRIAEKNLGTVAVFCGNRFLIIRTAFEEYVKENPYLL